MIGAPLRLIKLTLTFGPHGHLECVEHATEAADLTTPTEVDGGLSHAGPGPAIHDAAPGALARQGSAPGQARIFQLPALPHLPQCDHQRRARIAHRRAVRKREVGPRSRHHRDRGAGFRTQRAVSAGPVFPPGVNPDRGDLDSLESVDREATRDSATHLRARPPRWACLT